MCEEYAKENPTALEPTVAPVKRGARIGVNRLKDGGGLITLQIAGPTLAALEKLTELDFRNPESVKEFCTTFMRVGVSVGRKGRAGQPVITARPRKDGGPDMRTARTVKMTVVQNPEPTQ